MWHDKEDTKTLKQKEKKKTENRSDKTERDRAALIQAVNWGGVHPISSTHSAKSSTSSLIQNEPSVSQEISHQADTLTHSSPHTRTKYTRLSDWHVPLALCWLVEKSGSMTSSHRWWNFDFTSSCLWSNNLLQPRRLRTRFSSLFKKGCRLRLMILLLCYNWF